MFRFVSIVFLFSFFYSCNNRFSDYTEKQDGVYMKLLSFEEGDEAYTNQKNIIADIKIYDDNQLIYNHYKEDLADKIKSFTFLAAYLKEGDRATFMVNSSYLKKQFKLLRVVETNAEFLRVDIDVEEYTNKAFQNIDKEMLEQLLLKRYLKENNIKQHRNNIYSTTIRKGEGEPIKNGNQITVNYRGYFINSLEFDNSYKKTSLSFTYGNPGQVIKGLEKALKGMKQGEKSKIIIPSQFAFGDEGSSTQIVPPFTTVIYELEIINVK